MTTAAIDIALLTATATIASTVVIVLFISLLKQICYTQDKSVKGHLTYTTIIVFTLSIIFGIARIPYYTYCGNTFVVRMISWAAFVLTLDSIYIFLLLQLYYTFQESVFRISKCQVFMHSINIAMLSVIFFPGFIIFELFFVWITSLTIGYIHLLYKFNHNLFVLVLSQRKTSANTQKIGSIQLNMRQIKLLSIIRKHAILGGFIIFSNLCLGVHLVTLHLLRYTRIMMFVDAVILHIFIIVAPLCLYLGFQQNESIYGKCCNLCDKKCKHICIVITEKGLNKQNDETQSKV